MHEKVTLCMKKLLNAHKVTLCMEKLLYAHKVTLCMKKLFYAWNSYFMHGKATLCA